MRIGRHSIGQGPCFIIAEAGVNHNGQPELALELVRAASAAGADAVKFQTFRAEALATLDAPKARYQTLNTGTEGSQYEMLKQLELPPASYPAILEECRRQRILFLSSPFDEQSADFLESLEVEAYKLGSGELTNRPLLLHVAGKGRPLILSTGMANLGEVERAVQALEQSLERLALLHCVSDYPAAPVDCNLRAMETLRVAFGVPVGFSDHTGGRCVSLAAVALGAAILEKHLTIDKSLPGPDHSASLEPGEFKALVRESRLVEAALGTGRKVPSKKELDTARVARRSLVSARCLSAGQCIGPQDLALRRPGTGLDPQLAELLVGRTLRCDVPEGTLLSLDLFG
ncbi:N-acetylneuraminate synthase [bacterium CPR1]|nr:N-acetylneuraminate synthase [bacterium CPR1]